MAQRNLQILVTAKNRAQKQLRGLKGQIDEMQPAFRKMAIGGGAAMAGIGYGIKQAVDEASRAKDIQRTFDSVFTETNKDMEKWATKMSNEFGRLDTDMKKMSATAAGVLKPAFDISNEEIANMTKGMGEAAVAMAAYDPRIDNSQQAMEGFTQALIGNRQRVIDWGFQVRDAQLKVKALEQGVVDVDGMTRVAGEGMKTASGKMLSFQEAADKASITLTQQQEAMITSKAIMENTGIAQDVLKKSQQDWSEIQKRLTAKIRKTLEVIGNQFLPMVENLGQKLIPIIKNIKNWVQEHPKLTKYIIIGAAALATLITVLGALGIAVAAITPAIGFLGTIIGALMSPITIVIAIVAVLAVVIYKNWGKIKSVTISVFTAVKNFFVSVWTSVKEFFLNVVESIRKGAVNKFNQIKNFLSNVWSALKTVFKTSLNFIVGLWVKIFALMGVDLKEWIEKVKTWVSTFWSGLKALFQRGKEILTQVWRFIWNSIYDYYAKKFGAVKTGVVKVIEFIKKMFKAFKEPLVVAWKSAWEALISAFNSVKEKIKEPITGLLDWIKDKFEAISDMVGKVIGKAKDIGGNIVSAGQSVTGMRANGGPVSAGGSYVVGERGPEIFKPSSSGRIIPNGGGGTSVNVTVYGDVSGEEVVEKVKKSIKGELDLNTNLIG